MQLAQVEGFLEVARRANLSRADLTGAPLAGWDGGQLAAAIIPV